MGPSGWYENHAEDYARVHKRLRDARTVLLDGDIEDAVDNLQKAYMFAVLSIQTEKDRHERAFVRWCAGDADVSEACLDTVYGGNKADWAEDALADVHWPSLVRDVRECVRKGERAALMGMCERVKGVAYRKWAFTLAMSGIWEVCCIDSNVGAALEISDRAAEDPSSADPSEYVRLCDRVHECVREAPNPFLAQWAVYDFQRGEHARHMVYFNELDLSDS